MAPPAHGVSAQEDTTDLSRFWSTAEVSLGVELDLGVSQELVELMLDVGVEPIPGYPPQGRGVSPIWGVELVNPDVSWLRNPWG